MAKLQRTLKYYNTSLDPELKTKRRKKHPACLSLEHHTNKATTARNEDIQSLLASSRQNQNPNLEVTQVRKSYIPDPEGPKASSLHTLPQTQCKIQVKLRSLLGCMSWRKLQGQNLTCCDALNPTPDLKCESSYRKATTRFFHIPRLCQTASDP